MFFPFLCYCKVKFMLDLHLSEMIPAKGKEKVPPLPSTFTYFYWKRQCCLSVRQGLNDA